MFAYRDVFDIRRDPDPHLSVGNGIHLYRGHFLTRSEGQEVFSAPATRFPSLRPATDVAEYEPVGGVHRRKRLPVVRD